MTKELNVEGSYFVLYCQPNEFHSGRPHLISGSVEFITEGSSFGERTLKFKYYISKTTFYYKFRPLLINIFSFSDSLLVLFLPLRVSKWYKVRMLSLS